MSCSKIAILEKAVSSFDRPFTISELCCRMARTSPKSALTHRETQNLLPHLQNVRIIGRTSILYSLKMRTITLYLREAPDVPFED